MLVSEIIDATYLEWLYPSGIETPLYDVLATAIDADDTAIVLEGRAENVPRDSVLEIGAELLLTEEVSGSNVTVNERGYFGTTPATHAAGARVLIDPTYTRKAIFDSLAAVIGLLFPWGLYARGVETNLTYTTRNVLELPTGAEEILSILVRKSTNDELYNRLKMPGVNWTLYSEFDPPKFQLLRGGSYGAEMRVVYSKDFTKPTAESDDLDDLGVSSSLQPYLPMAITGHLLQGREIPRVQVEEIRRMLASQGVQVGAALNVGQSILQGFRRDYVMAERRRLSEKDDPGFEYVGN